MASYTQVLVLVLHSYIVCASSKLEICTDSCTATTAVFDGHGGHSAADYMSKNFYKLLSVSIDDETHESDRKVESKFFPAC